MGNIGSSAGNVRRRQGSRRGQPPPPPPIQPLQQHDTGANRYMYSATPYPNPNGHNPYYQYPGYYPPPPANTVPLPGPYDHYHHRPPPMYPCPMIPQHQKAMTIRNDVNLKSDTLKVEPDEENPGCFLVAFTFDAMVAGSMTVIFFAKEGDNCDLTPTKEESIPPIVVPFEPGLGQKFRQPSGTGIDFSKFEESELLKEGSLEVFPLAIKAEATSAIGDDDANRPNPNPNPDSGTSSSNSQITKVVFEKEKGQFRVKVVKQILWVNGMRYELHEIYGVGGNSVEGGIEDDGNDPGKECVICLSEPRDTTVLPCRHMCMCSGCAKVLSFQTNRCPICRQPVERFLEIKVNNGLESQGEENNH